MTRTYSYGRLKTLPGYVNDVSYWANGMRHVITHSNGIVDTQTVTNMPRPSTISFGTYDRCVKPSFAVQPLGGQVAAPGDSWVLTAQGSGTGPFEYQWYDVIAGVVGNTASITVHPTTTKEYFVVVSNQCGSTISETVKVTIGQCPAPTTGIITPVPQADGSWILTPHPEARQPRTYSWIRLSDNAGVGTSATLAVPAVSVTTSYQLTINDICGVLGTGTVTITVPLPVTLGLQATATSQNQISVTWPAISGATQYTVYRRSGVGWVSIATTSVASYTDTVAPSQTYAYHVTSNNGGQTDYDVATTMSFVAAVPGQAVTAVPVNDMLNAVNKVRAAVGWPALTWSNILAANDPLPAPGAMILARHVMSCRARMNEALQALGVRVRDYTDPDLYHVVLKASAINEVQQRAQ